ncbi:topoisomerase DNA-binding C4 zinc finger domain-containing protein [Pontiella desulfatans]|uniref:topoisomerase DNA-binding C4 zinc finger domain-containing protein n=1 Tax=Pontiella desulfatans TaxID=2750659 RepID=UPI00109CBF34|nr:topoisomerase DNA-binding C4 zinc finger domain-containing protein [Pontiella desulfatans]
MVNEISRSQADGQPPTSTFYKLTANTCASGQQPITTGLNHQTPELPASDLYSLGHGNTADDPVLEVVLSDKERFPNAEERRLFYVAVTRARHKVFILSDRQKASSFVRELEDTTSDLATCPDCHGKIFIKNNGDHDFVTCENYPLCDYSKYFNNPGEIAICPTCRRGYLCVKKGSKGEFCGCTNYPSCSHTTSYPLTQGDATNVVTS